MSPFKILVTTLAFIWLSGCATSNVSKDFSFNPTTNSGLLIGSLTQDKKPGTYALNARVFISSLDKNSETVIIESRDKKFAGILPGFVPGDFEDFNGKLYAVEIPAGVYQVTNWNMTNDNGLHINPKSPPPPLSFEVKAGEIVYIGNIHFNVLTGKNIFGMTLPGAAYPEIIHVDERDLAVFKSKFPQFSNHKVSMHTTREGGWYTDLETSRKIQTAPIIPIN